MGPLDKYILAGDSLTATDTGFDLDIRSHWYRSLPLSSLGKLQVKLDNRTIPQERIKIELDGASYTMDELPSLYTTWWFVLDAATLHVQDDSQHVKKGNTYKVEVEIGLLIPYVLTGKNEDPLFASGIAIKTLHCN